MSADRAVRLARVVEAMGADVSLRVTSRDGRLRRVEDAWLRELSRRSVIAAARDPRLRRDAGGDGPA